MKLSHNILYCKSLFLMICHIKTVKKSDRSEPFQNTSSWTVTSISTMYKTSNLLLLSIHYVYENPIDFAKILLACNTVEYLLSFLGPIVNINTLDHRLMTNFHSDWQIISWSGQMSPIYLLTVEFWILHHMQKMLESDWVCERGCLHLWEGLLLDAAIVIIHAAAWCVLMPPVIKVPPHLGYGCPQ